MYKLIKNLLINTFPTNVIYRFEHIFRKLWSILYMGNSVFCPICAQSFSKFIEYENGELLCPGCGSIKRKRLLILYLDEVLKIKTKKKRILHFSPNRQLSKKMKQLVGNNYIITDYENIQADKQYDITSIDCEKESYDLIICYHVLEHILEDIKAMNELNRILDKMGTLLIQVPFKSGEIYEDKSIISPEDRLREFGQDDHVRIYSLNGLIERLQSVGFNTKSAHCVDIYSEEEIKKYGLNETEIIVVCTKQ